LVEGAINIPGHFVRDEIAVGATKNKGEAEALGHTPKCPDSLILKGFIIVLETDHSVESEFGRFPENTVGVVERQLMIFEPILDGCPVWVGIPDAAFAGSITGGLCLYLEMAKYWNVPGNHSGLLDLSSWLQR
jgi:hypothetical protein